MKVNPELGNVIKFVAKENTDQYTEKAQNARNQEEIADIVSVENKQASRSQVENVDEAKRILSLVTRDMESVSSDLYNLNYQRVSQVIN